MDYRIVRRAWGQFAEIEIVTGWQAAMLRSMELETTNRDGEYLLRHIGEDYHRPVDTQCPVQAAWAYL
jgi:hypothetical protein